jgi:hypothetical protein
VCARRDGALAALRGTSSRGRVPARAGRPDRPHHYRGLHSSACVSLPSPCCLSVLLPRCLTWNRCLSHARTHARHLTDLASRFGQDDVVQYLVSKGADVNGIDKVSRRRLHHCERANERATVWAHCGPDVLCDV